MMILISTTLYPMSIFSKVSIDHTLSVLPVKVRWFLQYCATKFFLFTIEWKNSFTKLNFDSNTLIQTKSLLIITFPSCVYFAFQEKFIFVSTINFIHIFNINICYCIEFQDNVYIVCYWSSVLTSLIYNTDFLWFSSIIIILIHSCSIMMEKLSMLLFLCPFINNYNGIQ